MIFSPEHCELIPLGLKTNTRRVCKKGEYPGLIVDGQILWVCDPSGRVKWMVGRTYAFQPGRGKKALGRTLLLALRGEPLQDITVEDCIAEGIRLEDAGNFSPFLADVWTLEEYERRWDSINKRKGTRWNDAPDVWVHTFEFVEGSDD